MKLATYKDASRDGQLVVVARDLSSAHYATGIANKLQQVLEDWNFMAPQLQDLYEQLNSGKARHAFPFDPSRCMAPLPRSYQWVGSTAFGHHAKVMARAAGLAAEDAPTDSQLVQGCGDAFVGPCDDVAVDGATPNLDFQAQIAVVTGDLAQGADPERALDSVRLLLLANDLTLHGETITPGSPALSGTAWVQSKPGTAFSPVAVTPDEVSDAWRQGRLHLTLQNTVNGRKVGMCEAGPDMTFHFGQLLSALVKTRALHAGSVIGSGPVSNEDASHGYSCMAEKRAMELLEDGKAKARFLRPGDSLRIEVKGKNGQSVFGAIEQKVLARQDA